MTTLLQLRSDLAALEMRWALTKLAYKYNFDPAQPRVPAGTPDGGRWTDAGGAGWVRVAANDRGEGGIATDAAPKPIDKTRWLPRGERDKARRALVLKGDGGSFYVGPNPDADPSAPWYADSSKSMVGAYNDGILFASAKEGVDPDLIRAVMYVETTQGSYFGASRFLDARGLSRTILPMNIYADLWPQLGSRKELSEPLNNIVAGTKILKGIAANLDAPDIAKVATLYNALDATKISDYGARVASVYKKKPWLK